MVAIILAWLSAASSLLDLYDIIMKVVLCTWVLRERWKLSCSDLMQKPTVFLDPAAIDYHDVDRSLAC